MKERKKGRRERERGQHRSGGYQMKKRPAPLWRGDRACNRLGTERETGPKKRLDDRRCRQFLPAPLGSSRLLPAPPRSWPVSRPVFWPGRRWFERVEAKGKAGHCLGRRHLHGRHLHGRHLHRPQMETQWIHPGGWEVEQADERERPFVYSRRDNVSHLLKPYLCVIYDPVHSNRISSFWLFAFLPFSICWYYAYDFFFSFFYYYYYDGDDDLLFHLYFYVVSAVIYASRMDVSSKR